MLMIRHAGLGLILAGAVASPPSSSAWNVADPALRSNVLFLIVDDLRAELGGPYGSAVVQSPNINRLARRGVTMLRAYCQFSMCSVSKARSRTSYDSFSK
jgi:arylsulfatase A-like enzyme